MSINKNTNINKKENLNTNLDIAEKTNTKGSNQYFIKKEMLRLIYLSTSFLIYNYYYKLIFFKPLCHILHGLHIYGIIHNKENTTFIFPFKIYIITVNLNII